ncbi:hypothetical protein FE784_36820 [Paenibacillus hemerocallicola]|uniref:Uncharacterized protein n=1 Tax=Paenibacillus hemerocallicola TaxID=1172614 RepID=A0A5C4SX53_9BACL|nr:hypothetical protein [Paenibacillus hemerocallicola]TNJ59893.1 hypothetical protein FE784_36820 [Paenibacillus hemerocallicola]
MNSTAFCLVLHENVQNQESPNERLDHLITPYRRDILVKRFEIHSAAMLSENDNGNKAADFFDGLFLLLFRRGKIKSENLYAEPPYSFRLPTICSKKQRRTPKTKELSENRPLSSLVFSECHPILLLMVFQSLLLGQPLMIFPNGGN